MNPVQQQPADPNTLLNEIQKIKEGIATLQDLREGRLSVAQHSLLQSNSPREDETARHALNEAQREISSGYVKLKDDMTRIKKTPGSGNVQTQLEVQTRAIRKEFEDFQKSQTDYTRRLKEQVRRRVQVSMDQDAPPEEVDRAVDAVLAGHEQTFQVRLILCALSGQC